MTDREETLVYHFDRDIEQILHNIVNAWNRNKDYKKRWNINPKEEIFVNIKTQGTFLELRVEGLRGGWRYVGHLDQMEMNKHLEEMKKCLKQAEKDLRKEFKEKAGKGFRWSKGKEWADFQPVAMNGLYRFVASKSGNITVNVDRQKHSENGPDIKPSKIEKDKDSWRNVLELPERWR